MNYLNRYLIVIYICLTLTYAIDILKHNSNIEAIIPQLIMLAFVNISVVAAFFSKKWFGQVLLYANFFLVGLIPLVFGIISLWLTGQRTQIILKYACIGIPLLLIFLPIIAPTQDGAASTWEPDYRLIVYRLVQAIYWYTVFMYTSTHLKEELEKIEKKA